MWFFVKVASGAVVGGLTIVLLTLALTMAAIGETELARGWSYILASWFGLLLIAWAAVEVVKGVGRRLRRRDPIDYEALPPSMRGLGGRSTRS